MLQSFESQQVLGKIANLIAPLDFQQLYHLLINNGFNKQGYHHNYQNFYANDPLEFFLHFASEGVLNRLYFQPSLVNRDFLSILNELFNTPFTNHFYKTALVANFACSFLNHRLFHDNDVTGGTQREAADQFSNSDIEAMLACKTFSALPYFVIGDSHSRLYQHHGLFCSNGWLLPISITCRGGSARGLANTNSRFKYGKRLHDFFQRIQPAVTQGTKCFFKFGQVDLEYLFNFKWSQEGYKQFNEEKFIAYSNETIYHYIEFLSSLVPSSLREKTFVCSVSLPALADHVCKQTYLQGIFAFNQHKEDDIEKLRPTFDNMEIPTIQTRSRLHLEFNQRLQAKAEQAGFPFANDATLFMDEKTNMLKEVFTKKGAGLDVHLDRTDPTLLLMSQFIENLAK